jgi:hypothetical protein
VELLSLVKIQARLNTSLRWPKEYFALLRRQCRLISQVGLLKIEIINKRDPFNLSNFTFLKENKTWPFKISIQILIFLFYQIF